MKNHIYLSIVTIFLTLFQTLQAAPPSISTTFTAVSCNGGNNGTITVTATGGVAPYRFTIDGWATSQASNVFTGLTAGSYFVQASDANGANSASKKVTITQPAAVSFTTSTLTPTCYAGTNGRIYFVGSGGVGPYNYTVNGGATWLTSNNVNGLGAGTYTCQIRDSRQCTSGIVTITLTQPDRLTASAVATDVTCFGDVNGTINITAAGGVSPFQYSINGGGTWTTASSFNNLPTGSNYLYRVRDANACLTLIQGVTVGSPDPAVLAATVQDVTCFGANNGVISANATGGHHDFEYSIDGGASFLNANQFNALSNGNYTVIARDGSGCVTNTQTVQVNQPAQLVVSGTPSTYGCGYNTTGAGETDGAIQVTVAGGNGGNTFNWSTGDQSANIQNVGAGNYGVTVVDSKGCTAAQEWALTEPDPLVLSLSSKVYGNGLGISCPGMTDGEVYSAVSGGCGPYTYSWGGGQSTQDLYSVPSDSYFLTVTDQNGKQVDGSLFIAEPQPIDFWYEKADVSCYGVTDGEVQITTFSGIAPFTYSMNGGASFQTSPSFTNLSSGQVLSLQVTDAGGCTSDLIEVQMNTPMPLFASVTTRNPNNAALDNGKITVSGNQTNLEYSIDGGLTYSVNANFTGLTAGNYSVIVRNPNGCTSVPLAVTLTGGSNRAAGNQKQENLTETESGNTVAMADPSFAVASGSQQLVIKGTSDWYGTDQRALLRVSDLTGRMIFAGEVMVGSNWEYAIPLENVSGHVICVSLVAEDGKWKYSTKVFVD